MILASFVRCICLSPQTEEDIFKRFIQQHSEQIQKDILDRAYENKKDLVYSRFIYENQFDNNKTVVPWTYFLVSEKQTELFINYMKPYGYTCKVKNLGNSKIFTITWCED
jgi:hypothetical protein